jgi:addiction module HigA family antidote
VAHKDATKKQFKATEERKVKRYPEVRHKATYPPARREARQSSEPVSKVLGLNAGLLEQSIRKEPKRKTVSTKQVIKREELDGMDFSDVSTGELLAPVHPGEVLLHDFIEPLGISRYRVAKSMHVPQRRVDEICSGSRAISADTALRLERLFGMSAQAWLNLQSQYDLEVAARHLRQRIDAEVTPLTQAAA